MHREMTRRMAAGQANFLLVLLLSLASSALSQDDFYSFKVKDIKGNTVPLDKYRGKVTLVVNVASECGYTDSHYKELVRLQGHLAPTKHFTVLAFPCNQFGGQEPMGNAAIDHFAKSMYKANFPMFSKIDVVGREAHPAYKYLAESTQAPPTWNFWKYLVDVNGKVVSAWPPYNTVADIWSQVEAAVNRARWEKGQRSTEL
ncbi:PREDICTED: glutathione peroxidase 7-like [Branchiostoma belcheri]|uniref:Glutathione peroxidase n=1 Tax=Branchiostoma belcheri TaxID=7741 RepID=A0A6P4Z8W1_BRABE|nr:PREDICTED: glutathione peroxidase 7-like [Branchiostoma belcheri]